MAIIDKIRLSGTTYDLVDQSKAKVIEVTQQQYDAIVTPEANAIYVITDAPTIDISDFYNKSTINAMMALKQDALVSGTNIKTINNESILGSGNITIQGGGTSYAAGTNISLANDTISCTLPIAAGTHSTDKGIIIGDGECSSTGPWAVAIGHNADATGQASIVMGSNIGSSANYSLVIGSTGMLKAVEGSYSASIGEANNLRGTGKKCRFAFGGYLSLNNNYETGLGYYNQSYSASTTFGNSGNTLFTIGNGYSYQSTENPHNAFEVRQSGDIYVANTDDTTDTSSTGYSTKPMVRLQDTITATAANTTALGGLSLVKRTQAQYDAIVTKDPNVLYIIY